MAKKTLQQQIVEKLIEKGWSETFNSRSRKYRVFIHPGVAANVYVGSKGALRKGKNIKDSFSLDAKKFLAAD